MQADTVPGATGDLAWLAGELSAIRRELLPEGEARSLYLALDQGGTASRAVLFDAAGREVTSAHVPIATRRQAERVEHDPEELVASLLTAARDACDSPLVAGRSIVAAGLATQRSTVVCWDTTDGSALSPAISWQDRRNAAWLDETLGARAGWVRELTGLPLSPHYGAAKLRWCLDELPAVRLALRDQRLALGPLASFLLHRLCADDRPVCADPANASRTLLYDPALLDWSNPLLEAFGIPRDALPRCVGTEHPFGALTLDAQRRVALRACSGDQSAAAFVSGAPSPATGHINVGTGAFVQRVLRDAARPAPPGLLRSVVHALDDDIRGATCSHEGTVNGAGAALEWLHERTGLDVQRSLSTLHVALPPDDVELLFMNGVGGLGAPYWQPSFPIEFVDLRGRAVADPGGELQLVAAVVDSIAFLVATNVLAMHDASPLQRLTITGGLASCDYLCGMIADLTGMAVDRLELREATARGIAFLAAGRPADWPAVPVERSFAPSRRAAVLERFGYWHAAMEARRK